MVFSSSDGFVSLHSKTVSPTKMDRFLLFGTITRFYELEGIHNRDLFLFLSHVFSHRNLFFFRKDATLFEEQRWYPCMMRISLPPSKIF